MPGLESSQNSEDEDNESDNEEHGSNQINMNISFGDSESEVTQFLLNIGLDQLNDTFKQKSITLAKLELMKLEELEYIL